MQVKTAPGGVETYSVDGKAWHESRRAATAAIFEQASDGVKRAIRRDGYDWNTNTWSCTCMANGADGCALHS